MSSVCVAKYNANLKLPQYRTYIPTKMIVKIVANENATPPNRGILPL